MMMALKNSPAYVHDSKKPAQYAHDQHRQSAFFLPGHPSHSLSKIPLRTPARQRTLFSNRKSQIKNR